MILFAPARFYLNRGITNLIKKTKISFNGIKKIL